MKAGDDLAELIAVALLAVPGGAMRGDIVVITQKIVSKAEGRRVRLSEVQPSAEALVLAGTTGKDPRLVELVVRETDTVLRAVPNVLITRHRSGHVMANAGIDQSNIGPDGEGDALLLPIDADASAERMHAALGERVGFPIPVVVSDSFGRPWREGVVPVAIGAAGLPALHDRRGETDRDGRVLAVTQVAIADMLAAAAGLATGEGAEGVPAALIRGYPLPPGDRPAADLVRPIEQDLFR